MEFDQDLEVCKLAGRQVPESPLIVDNSGFRWCILSGKCPSEIVPAFGHPDEGCEKQPSRVNTGPGLEISGPVFMSPFILPPPQVKSTCAH